ncbi:unnamed protein product [marine sediment metagenome]|uniref:Uncharacterized protein n=1 Tax=marine sediment metagenome TaxID=412755 RepID=X0SH39_9ZZZZ
MTGRFWLGVEGSEVLFETGWSAFFEEEFEINRKGRVANGALVIDTIATKRRFKLKYAVMTQDTLDALMTEYNRGVILNLKVERSDDSIDEYSVKFMPIKRTRLLAMDQWLWKGASFTLEEV